MSSNAELNPTPDDRGVSVVGGTRSTDHALVGLASLLPQILNDVALDTTRGVHEAVAARTFAKIPGSAPVRIIHDRLSGAVYDTLGWSARTAEAVLSGLARRAKPHGGAVEPGRRGARTSLAILNGILGDLLEEEGNPLAITMSIRAGGRDVPPTRPELLAAFPRATGRVAVLLHGLVESDELWDVPTAGRLICYDDVLREGGVTPVRLRYNSGRHISDNAVDLADLLDRLVADWPVPVTELLLLGHSMGGLVIRGAAEVASVSGLRWLDLVDNVVMLGTPHSGAPLEVAANAGVALAGRIPEVAPFGDIIRRRSAGIKDLRHGYVARDEWEGHDPDGLRNPKARATDGLRGKGIHNVGATLNVDPDHPVSKVLGDLLVRMDSAGGKGQPWQEEATITHIGGITHMALLNHPTVADLLRALIDD